MDPTLLACLVTLAVIGLFVGYSYWKRRKHRRGEIANLPARVTNPRTLTHLRSVRLWQLRVESPAKACTWAQQTAGKRFSSESAIPLPIAGCGKSCRCNYLPVADGRRLVGEQIPVSDPLDFERIKPGDPKLKDRRRKDPFSQGTRNRH